MIHNYATGTWKTHKNPCIGVAKDKYLSCMQSLLIKKNPENTICASFGKTFSFTKKVLLTHSGYGNDYLPWLYTQPLQPNGGC
jgi:hypothetical protein